MFVHYDASIFTPIKGLFLRMELTKIDWIVLTFKERAEPYAIFVF